MRFFLLERGVVDDRRRQYQFITNELCRFKSHKWLYLPIQGHGAQHIRFEHCFKRGDRGAIWGANSRHQFGSERWKYAGLVELDGRWNKWFGADELRRLDFDGRRQLH